MPIDESCDYKEYYIKFNEEETGNQSFEKIVFKKNQSLNADNQLENLDLIQIKEEQYEINISFNWLYKRFMFQSFKRMAVENK